MKTCLEMIEARIDDIMREYPAFRFVVIACHANDRLSPSKFMIATNLGTHDSNRLLTDTVVYRQHSRPTE